MSQVHAQARTTPRTRAEIKASTETLDQLAERYNISRATVLKWKHRQTPEDLSHRPHKLHSRPCKTSATRMNIGFAPVLLGARFPENLRIRF
jgi:transposase